MRHISTPKHVKECMTRQANALYSWRILPHVLMFHLPTFSCALCYAHSNHMFFCNRQISLILQQVEVVLSADESSLWSFQGGRYFVHQGPGPCDEQRVFAAGAVPQHGWGREGER